MQPRGQQSQRLLQLPAAHPLLESAMAGLEGRILLRQLAPLRPRTQHPQHTIQHRPCVMPRAATVICSPSPAQHRLDELPLFIGQLPASCHAAFAGSHRAISECTIFKSKRFMRLVLGNRPTRSRPGTTARSRLASATRDRPSRSPAAFMPATRSRPIMKHGNCPATHTGRCSQRASAFSGERAHVGVRSRTPL